MKNPILLIIGAIAIALASCSDSDKDFTTNETQVQITDGYELEGIIGTIAYDNDSYVLVPNRDFDLTFYHNFPESDIQFYLDPQEFDLNEFIGKTVWIDGNIRVCDNEPRVRLNNVESFNLDVTDVFEYSIAVSRSSTDDVEYGCGTKSPTEVPNWILQEDEPVIVSRSGSDDICYDRAYDFKCYIHVVRTTSGSGNKTVYECLEGISSSLNSCFASTNFTFTMSGYEYIDSDAYYCLTSDNLSKLFNKNAHLYGIDIYVVSGDCLISENYSGMSADIVSSAFAVHSRFVNTTTVSHEMGHCLGLFHTHHGTSEKERGPSTTPELVDGSNSSIAGDYIVDTPADPYKWSFFGEYNGGNLTDANGDLYNPDPTNIMSYSSAKYRFTDRQLYRMNKAIENEFLIGRTATVTKYTISGPKVISDGSATYTVNFPQSDGILWEITKDTYTDRSSSAVTSVEELSGSSITIDDTGVYDQKITIAALYDNDNGVHYKTTTTAYVAKPNSQTGYLRWGTESSYGNFVGSYELNNIDRTKPITCYPGSTIYFYYSLRCGANSPEYPDVYDFNVISSDNPLSKAASNVGKHAFVCDSSINCFNGNIVLQISINGYSQYYSLPLLVKSKPQVNSSLSSEMTAVDDDIETVSNNLNNH